MACTTRRRVRRDGDVITTQGIAEFALPDFDMPGIARRGSWAIPNWTAAERRKRTYENERKWGGIFDDARWTTNETSTVLDELRIGEWPGFYGPLFSHRRATR